MYKTNIRLFLKANNLKLSKSRIVLKEEEINRIKKFKKIDPPKSLEHIINNIWSLSSLINHPTNSTI